MLLANSLAGQHICFSFFLQPGADVSCRDAFFSTGHKPRCLTTVFASDAGAKAGAIGSSSETTELRNRGQRPRDPAFVCEQRRAGDKSLPCNCTFLPSVTDVRPWSGSSTWAGVWVSSERAQTAPPERGGWSQRYALQVSRRTGSRIQMRASCSGLHRG